MVFVEEEVVEEEEDVVVEFGEDDIVYQFVVMGEDYGFDFGEYGDYDD